MKKTILGLVLGGVLGVFDGLSAMISAPQEAPNIVGIVIGSTFKGLVAGALIGWFASKRPSLPAVLMVGVLVSGFFAFLVALAPNAEGGHYWAEIMIPGAILGLIVGYATQKYGSVGGVRS